MGMCLLHSCKRCNYNVKQVKKSVRLIKEALLSEYVIPEHYVEEAVMPIHLYIKTGLADIVCIQHIEKDSSPTTQ